MLPVEMMWAVFALGVLTGISFALIWFKQLVRYYLRIFQGHDDNG